MKLLRLAVNVVAYQCAWIACVLSAAAQRPALGMMVALAVVLWHLFTAPSPSRELLLIAIATSVGVAFESLLVATGWVRMSPGLLFGSVTPLWMVAMLAAFATTLNVSLRALRPHYLWSALMAAVGAPLAYHAGAQLGALHWGNQWPALLTIALGWAVLTPLLMRSAQRFDGFSTS